MVTNRLWTLGAVIVIVVLIAGTWFIGISPRLAEAATANTDRAAVAAQNAVQAATLASLKKQFDGIADLRSDLAALQVAIPADDATAELISQLNAFASAAGVTITDLTIANPERYIPPAEPSADAELSAAASSVSPDNFLAVRVELGVSGEQGKVMTFLESVQSGDRTFLVYDLSLEDGLPASGASVEARFTGQVFVLLDGVAATPTGEPAAEGADVVPAEGGSVPQ